MKNTIALISLSIMWNLSLAALVFKMWAEFVYTIIKALRKRKRRSRK